ncbi:MAG: hypothetical protein WA581_21185 [Candidatus Acidiferrales bacterium]
MLALVAAVIGLLLFFGLVLYLCVRNRKEDSHVAPDAPLDVTAKSPLGRWRY